MKRAKTWAWALASSCVGVGLGACLSSSNDAPSAAGNDGGASSGFDGASASDGGTGTETSTRGEGGTVIGGARPNFFAIDDVNVYWTAGDYVSTDGGAVMRAPKSGGPAVTIATGQQAPSRIVVDGANVYWIDQYITVGTQGSVMRAAATGSDSPALVLTYQDFRPRFLVVVAGTTYVTDVELVVVPSDGGAPFNQTLPIDIAEGLVSDGTNLFWSEVPGSTPAPVIYQLPLAQAAAAQPPTPETIAALSDQEMPNLQAATGLAVDGANVYWSDVMYTDATRATVAAYGVYKAAIGVDGGAPEEVVSIPAGAGAKPIAALATDGVDVYFTAGRYVMRAPVGGGSPTTLVTGSPSDAFGDVKVDGTTVYFATESGIAAVAK